MSALSFVDGIVGVLIGYSVCWFWQVRPMRRLIVREVTEMQAMLEETREGHRLAVEGHVAKIDEIADRIGKARA